MEEEFLRKYYSVVKTTFVRKTTHLMSIADPIAIGVEIIRIDSGHSLEKEFIEWILMNP